MFPAERIKIIKKYLQENRKVEVAGLSTLLSVSEVTVRRDLEKLEQEGFLNRTHGGALLAEEKASPSYTEFMDTDPMLSARQAMTKIAKHLISDNDVIMLPQGQTNLLLAKELDEIRNLTVLTNDLLIALELSRYSDIKIIVLGGDMGLQSKALYGQFAINSLHNFNVQKIFVEVEGLTESSGMSVTSIEHSNLISQAFKIADQKIIFCPAENMGKKAFFPLGPIELADIIITNPEIQDSYKNIIFQKEIKLFTSIQLTEGSL